MLYTYIGIEWKRIVMGDPSFVIMSRAVHWQIRIILFLRYRQSIAHNLSYIISSKHTQMRPPLSSDWTQSSKAAFEANAAQARRAGPGCDACNCSRVGCSDLWDQHLTL